MTALPTELWLIIFDLVIEEGIIRVDQCDSTKFPYIQSILSASHLRYHAFDSYYRLRLVCRSFKGILGDPPSYKLSSSSTFPPSTTIRALILDLVAWPGTNFQLPSAELLPCRRLVYLDVTCGLLNSDHPNLSDFLHACEGRAFPNVQRLTLQIVNNLYTEHQEITFWAHLHDAFPLLVTLVITQEISNGRYLMLNSITRAVPFEWLETVYLGSAIGYAGCRFPRLRHATTSGYAPYELEILTISSHLESLLILTPYDCLLNLSSCPRLKLLGIHQDASYYGKPPEGYHPLEHLWIFPFDRTKHRPTAELLKKLPQISRVTFDVSSEESRTGIAKELQRIFSSIGLNMRPHAHGDTLLVMERSPLQVGGWRRSGKSA